MPTNFDNDPSIRNYRENNTVKAVFFDGSDESCWAINLMARTIGHKHHISLRKPEYTMDIPTPHGNVTMGLGSYVVLRVRDFEKEDGHLEVHSSRDFVYRFQEAN